MASSAMDATAGTSAASAPVASGPFAANELGLDPRLVKALGKMGFERPTPIQAQALPVALAGKDVILKARTGSGKTVAYALAVLQRLLQRKAAGEDSGPVLRAIVLLPTRELVDQTAAVFTSLTHYCRDTLRVVAVGGAAAGSSSGAAITAGGAKRGPGAAAGGAALILADVLIGTAGKVRKMCLGEASAGKGGAGAGAGSSSSGAAAAAPCLSSLEALVLDEADLLTSYGYGEDVRALASAVPRARCQSILLSATLPPQLDELRRVALHKPVTIKADDGPGGAGGGAGGMGGHLSQFFIRVGAVDRFLLLFALIKLRLIGGRALFFVNSVASAYKLRLFLERFSISAAVLNAELPANSRAATLSAFNRGLVEYLIATDEATGGAPAEAETTAAEGQLEDEDEDASSAGDAEAAEDDDSDEDDHDDEAASEDDEAEDDDDEASDGDSDGSGGSSGKAAAKAKAKGKASAAGKGKSSSALALAVGSKRKRPADADADSDDSSDAGSSDEDDDLDDDADADDAEAGSGSNSDNDSDGGSGDDDDEAAGSSSSSGSAGAAARARAAGAKAAAASAKANVKAKAKPAKGKAKGRGAGADGDGADFGVARGIDFRGVTTVINVEPPQSSSAYVHRIGRTARGGASGVAVTFVPPEGLEPTADTLLETLQRTQARDVATGAPQPSPLPFDVGEVEGFRYRVEDVLRSITPAAVREARAAELRTQLATSAALAAHFEDNPGDLDALLRPAHARALQPKAVQAHLKDVPTYLLPASLRAAVEAAGGGVAVGSGRGRGAKRGRHDGGGSGSGRGAAAMGGRGPAPASMEEAAASHQRISASTVVSLAAQEAYSARRSGGADPLRAFAYRDAPAAHQAAAMAAERGSRGRGFGGRGGGRGRGRGSGGRR